jgi:hypothetical protein
MRSAKVGEVAGVLEKSGELVDVVRGAETRCCEAGGSSGGLFGCGRAQGIVLRRRLGRRGLRQSEQTQLADGRKRELALAGGQRASIYD